MPTPTGDRHSSADDGRPGALILWAHWVRAGVLRRLRPTSKDVFAVLVAFASREGHAFPAVSTIAKLTGHTRGRIFKGLQELVKVGAISREGHVKRRGLNAKGPVLYRVLSPPMGIPAEDVRARDTHEAAEGHEIPAVTPIGVPFGYRGGTGPDTEGVSPRDTGGVSGRDTQIGYSYRYPDRKEMEGGGGGVQRGNLDASARSASPLEAAPLASVVTETDLFGPDPEAWEGKAKDNGSGRTRAEKDRDHIRLFMEADVKLGGGLKPLEEYVGPRWFPPRYDRGVLREVYEEVKARAVVPECVRPS